MISMRHPRPYWGRTPVGEARAPARGTHEGGTEMNEVARAFALEFLRPLVQRGDALDVGRLHT